MTKEIPLGRTGQVAIVDDEDYEKAMQHKWYLHRHGYAVRTFWKNGKRTSTTLHRHLDDTPPGLQIDHIDRDGLNNRRSNLRRCTIGQNNTNRGNRRNTSGFRGVSWNRGALNWQANIGVNGKLHRIGGFNDPVSAAIAYNWAAMRHHGEFAQLNVI